MNLAINSTRLLITMQSSLVDLFVATPVSYTEIKIIGKFNGTEITKTYTPTNLITSSTDVSTNGGVETINPSFFNLTEFPQGIYSFEVYLKNSAQVQTDESCLYVENGLKCQVDDILLDSTKTVNERILAGLTYQSLLDTDSCPCKCDKYLLAYNYLIDVIANNKCKTC